VTANTPTLQVTEFTGINNKTDPQTVGTNGFVVADNVDIDSTGTHLSARHGQTLEDATAFRGAFATTDALRCYAVTGSGDLVNWNGAAQVLRSGFVGYPYWVQIANVVFVGNENQCWRIPPNNQVEDNAASQPAPLKLTAVAGALPPGQYRFVQVSVMAGGRESAPSVPSVITLDGTQNVQISGITGQRIYVCPADSKVFGWWLDTGESVLVYAQGANTLGEELTTLNLYPMQAGRALAYYEGRLYCAVYDQATKLSVIFRSLPGYWDLCEPLDVKMIPGEVRAMAGLPSGLVVCTDRQIGSIDTNDNWIPFADYGVPPGQPIAFDQKVAGEPATQCWIWTNRGVCKALPFIEVTPQFAPPIADWTGAAIVRSGGDERFVATLSPFAAADNAT
jgi:hypothetical protein